MVINTFFKQATYLNDYNFIFDNFLESVLQNKTLYQKYTTQQPVKNTLKLPLTEEHEEHGSWYSKLH